MNKYSVLKIVSFIISVLIGVSFLAVFNSATQTAHIIIFIVLLLVPAVLFAILGRWALKKEKETNLNADPDYYVNLKKEKELKKAEKKERAQQLQEVKQRKIEEAELLKSQESIDDYISSNSSALNVKPKEIKSLISASKTVQIGRLNSDELFVDDINKEFYILQGKTLHRFGYDKLSDFEYSENGKTIVSGKAASTIVGGLLLGPLGALAGASGKRKQNEEVKSAKVNIFINDLNTSLIEFDVPLKGISKSSGTYDFLIRQVDEFLSTLNYIKNNSN